MKQFSVFAALVHRRRWLSSVSLDLVRMLLLILSLLAADVCAAADWPGIAYSEVRGYAYNKRGLVGTSIIRHGRLARSVINGHGVILTVEQARPGGLRHECLHGNVIPMIVLNTGGRFDLYHPLHELTVIELRQHHICKS